MDLVVVVEEHVPDDHRRPDHSDGTGDPTGVQPSRDAGDGATTTAPQAITAPATTSGVSGRSNQYSMFFQKPLNLVPVTSSCSPAGAERDLGRDAVDDRLTVDEQPGEHPLGDPHRGEPECPSSDRNRHRAEHNDR